MKNLDQITDMLGEFALEKHLGILTIPLPDPEELRRSLEETCQTMLDIIFSPDDEDEEELDSEDDQEW